MRMLKSHLQVASTQVGVGFRLSNEQYLAARDRIKTDLCWHSLHNTRSMLQCIVGDILHDYFIKFNVHVRLQGLGLPGQRELTPRSLHCGETSPAHRKVRSPLRTTSSHF
jgi:hypothetical protein